MITRDHFKALAKHYHRYRLCWPCQRPPHVTQQNPVDHFGILAPAKLISIKKLTKKRYYSFRLRSPLDADIKRGYLSFFVISVICGTFIKRSPRHFPWAWYRFKCTRSALIGQKPIVYYINKPIWEIFKSLTFSSRFTGFSSFSNIPRESLSQ